MNSERKGRKIDPEDVNQLAIKLGLFGLIHTPEYSPRSVTSEDLQKKTEERELAYEITSFGVDVLEALLRKNELEIRQIFYNDEGERVELSVENVKVAVEKLDSLSSLWIAAHDAYSATRKLDQDFPMLDPGVVILRTSLPLQK